MKTIPLVCGFALALGVIGTLSAQNDVIIQNRTYSANQNETVDAINTITAETAVVVQADATVTYLAGAAIYLRPGFSVQNGAVFHALTKADTDGDGMPDSWEVANGFDPNNAADASQNADGDSLTNLQEYLLGTNPKSTAQTATETQIKLNIHQPR